jgi:hypothetical protein
MVALLSSESRTGVLRRYNVSVGVASCGMLSLLA